MTAAGELSRSNLSERVLEVLSRGGWGNPDVLLVRARGGSVVVKDFAPRPALVRWIWGRWITRRERRAYERLAGHSHVPKLLGGLGPFALVIEYRPGRRLERSLAAELPAGFLPELTDAVEDMHRSGVVHLDLRHRDNILATPEGVPVLLDFASALCFRPGSFAARWIQPLCCRIDRRALDKWRVRLQPRPAQEAPSVGSRGASRPM
ncbi:MAG: hypothetical protein MJE66_00280 [Proteobacteria bacterium]|nr:hypothetical protein [Pseudomonadota bacterium]